MGDPYDLYKQQADFALEAMREAELWEPEVNLKFAHVHAMLAVAHAVAGLQWEMAKH